jgi:hypothetical protein
VLGYFHDVGSLVQRELSSQGRYIPRLSRERVGSPAGGSWGDARQDRDDDELNYALLPRVLVDSRYIGFPVKRRNK